jgi:hypothetical protein
MPFFVMIVSPSVIVGDLDVMGSVSHPDKTDPPLIVDSDTVLSGPLPFQLLKSVSGWRRQVFEIGGTVEHCEFPLSDGPEAREFFDRLSCKEPLRLFIPEAWITVSRLS